MAPEHRATERPESFAEMIARWRRVAETKLHEFNLDRLNKQSVDGMAEGIKLCAADAEQIEKRLRALVQRIRPKPDALMEYDGDNHGDTATAASNSTAEWIAGDLEAILGPEVRP